MPTLPANTAACCVRQFSQEAPFPAGMAARLLELKGYDLPQPVVTGVPTTGRTRQGVVPEDVHGGIAASAPGRGNGNGTPQRNRRRTLHSEGVKAELACRSRGRLTSQAPK